MLGVFEGHIFLSVRLSGGAKRPPPFGDCAAKGQCAGGCECDSISEYCSKYCVEYCVEYCVQVLCRVFAEYCAVICAPSSPKRMASRALPTGRLDTDRLEGRPWGWSITLGLYLPSLPRPALAGLLHLLYAGQVQVAGPDLTDFLATGAQLGMLGQGGRGGAGGGGINS